MSLPSQRVIGSLEQVMEWRGKPSAIRLDNGPEYIARALIDWANAQQITLMYIQPGKPTQMFESVEQAQLLATEWLWTYNNERSHTAIGGVPPRQLLKAA